MTTNSETKPTILIVEDNEINSNVLQDYLSDRYNIIVADNGITAIDTIYEKRNELSLVLLDIVLPDIEVVRGDVNSDEMINARDIGTFRRDFGKAVENCTNPYTDINGDGNVNARDINLLRKSFGKSAEKDCAVEYTA